MHGRDRERCFSIHWFASQKATLARGRGSWLAGCSLLSDSSHARPGAPLFTGSQCDVVSMLPGGQGRRQQLLQKLP